MVLVAIGGEAFEIVFEEEETVEGRVLPLNGDVPGQHHEEIEDYSGEPDGAA